MLGGGHFTLVRCGFIFVAVVEGKGPVQATVVVLNSVEPSVISVEASGDSVLQILLCSACLFFHAGTCF